MNQSLKDLAHLLFLLLHNWISLNRTRKTTNLESKSLLKQNKAFKKKQKVMHLYLILE